MQINQKSITTSAAAASAAAAVVCIMGIIDYSDNYIIYVMRVMSVKYILGNEQYIGYRNDN